MHIDTDNCRMMERVNFSTLMKGDLLFSFLQLPYLKRILDIFWLIYDIVIEFRWVALKAKLSCGHYRNIFYEKIYNIGKL